MAKHPGGCYRYFANLAADIGIDNVPMMPVPFKILQTDKLVVLVYEAFNLWRHVFLDQREWIDDLRAAAGGHRAVRVHLQREREVAAAHDQA